jgi:hypothetical protein
VDDGDGYGRLKGKQRVRLGLEEKKKMIQRGGERRSSSDGSLGHGCSEPKTLASSPQQGEARGVVFLPWVSDFSG